MKETTMAKRRFHYIYRDSDSGKIISRKDAESRDPKTWEREKVFDD
jgi:hypothetical protein